MTPYMMPIDESPKMYITYDGELNFSIKITSHGFGPYPIRLYPINRVIDIRGKDSFNKLFTEIGVDPDIIDAALNEIDSLVGEYFSLGNALTEILVPDRCPDCMTLLYKLSRRRD